MFEVTVGSKTYNHEEVESISMYTDEDGDSQAWITFKMDVSKLVGLSVSISTDSLRDFVGEVDSVEEQTEYSCKLYCVGSSSPSSSKNEKALLPTESNLGQKSSTPTKQVKKSKKKI